MTNFTNDQITSLTDSEQEEEALAGLRRLGLSRERLIKWAQTDDDDFITAGMVLPYMTLRDARILEMRRFERQVGLPLEMPNPEATSQPSPIADEAQEAYTGEERNWLSRVAPDLVYGAVGLLPMDRPREVWLTDLKAAYTLGDGAAMLRFLTIKSGVPKGQLAHFRAEAFQTLGYPELTLFFRRMAAQELSSFILYQVLLLGDLWKYQKLLEARELSKDLLQRSGIENEEIISAASMLMMTSRLIVKSRGQGPETLIPYAKIALQALEPLFRGTAAPESFPMLGLLTLSEIYSVLGQREEEFSTYSAAIQQDPYDGDLYALRGNLLMHTTVDAALADYQQAIRLHTKTALPYLIVARHELQNGNIALSKRLCKTAYARAGEDKRIQAQATSILAFAELMSGGRFVDEVVGRFQSAANLDPQNEALQKNLEAVKEIAKELTAGQKNTQNLSKRQSLKIQVSGEEIKIMIETLSRQDIAPALNDISYEQLSAAYTKRTERANRELNRNMMRDATRSLPIAA